MFKRLFNVIFAGLFLYTPLAHSDTSFIGQDNDFMTYDWLISVGTQKYTMDYLPHFKFLFKNMKVRGMLEFGCGYSTKYFLDNASQVTSIEFITPGTSDANLNECKQLYKNVANWFPLAYIGSDSFNNACGYQCAYHKDYSLIDPRYIHEMDEYFKEIVTLSYVNKCPIDIAFVNPGIYIRGDIVNVLLSQKIPVIVAHDTASDTNTNSNEGLYGWFKVTTPSDYEKIYLPFEGGTTIWITKHYTGLVKAILRYRDSIQRANLQDKNFLQRYQEVSKIAEKA